MRTEDTHARGAAAIDAVSEATSAPPAPTELLEAFPGMTTLLAFYVGMCAVVVGGAIVAEDSLGWSGERTVFALCGLMFLVAASQRVPIVYRVLRHTGWFVHIRQPARMRVVLAGLSVLMLVVALFG